MYTPILFLTPRVCHHTVESPASAKRRQEMETTSLILLVLCRVSVWCVRTLISPGEETDMFRVDMRGFKAKGDIATLIGAPKGYQDSVRSRVPLRSWQRR